MGMYRTDYIVYGYKFDNKNNVRDVNGEQFDMWDDKYLPMVEGHLDEPFSLISGEGDNCMVFGKIIEMSCDEEVGWDYVDLSKISDKMTIDVMYKYKELFYSPTEEVPLPKLFIFSQWS